MVARTTPKTATRRQSAAERPRIRGRQARTRTGAANAWRSSTVPAGPTSSKRVFPKAAPSWTDATPANTRSAGGIRSARTMAVHRTEARERTHEELERIFEEVDAPFALVDLDAMWANGEAMLERAAGTAIRVASKSLRCRPLLAAILERDPGFRGLMTFTLPESLWLHEHGFEDLLIAYPTADRGALAELGQLDSERPPILMVDSVQHLDLIESAAGRSARPVRVCIDLDVSWWPLGGRLKIGVKRSPVRTPEQASALAREIVRRPGLELAGLMGYEAHIAGLGDSPLGKRMQAPVIRQIKRMSATEIAERRAAVVAAVSEVAPLPLVNGGGTGSIHTTRQEDVITEITAGSGFYAPTLFDRYASFRLTPAAMFAMPVVRRPSPSVATLLGGGYPPSGAAGRG